MKEADYTIDLEKVHQYWLNYSPVKTPSKHLSDLKTMSLHLLLSPFRFGQSAFLVTKDLWPLCQILLVPTPESKEVTPKLCLLTQLYPARTGP